MVISVEEIQHQRSGKFDKKTEYEECIRLKIWVDNNVFTLKCLDFSIFLLLHMLHACMPVYQFIRMAYDDSKRNAKGCIPAK